MSEPQPTAGVSDILDTIERAVTGRIMRYHLLFCVRKSPRVFEWYAQFRSEGTVRVALSKLRPGDRADAVLFDIRSGTVLTK